MRRPRLRILAALLLYQLVCTGADRPPGIFDGHLETYGRDLAIHRKYNDVDPGQNRRIVSEETRTFSRDTRNLGQHQFEESCPQASRISADRRVGDSQIVGELIQETRLKQLSSRLMNRRTDSLEADRRSAERRQVRRSVERTSDMRGTASERRFSDSLRRTDRRLDEKLVRDMQRRVDMRRTVDERRAVDQRLDEDVNRRADLRTREHRRDTRMENARQRIARRSIEERRFADSLRRNDDRFIRNTGRELPKEGVDERRMADGLASRRFEDRSSRVSRIEDTTNRVMRRSVVVLETRRSERRALEKADPVARREQSEQSLRRLDSQLSDRSAREDTPRRTADRRLIDGLRTERRVDDRLTRDSTSRVSLRRMTRSVEERRSATPDRRFENRSVNDYRMDSRRQIARSRSVDGRTNRRVEKQLIRDSQMEESQRRMSRSQSTETPQTDRSKEDRLTRLEDSQRRMESRSVDNARSDRRMDEQLTRNSQRGMGTSRSVESVRTDRRREERLTRNYRVEDSQRQIARSRTVDIARSDQRNEKRLARDSRMEDSPRRVARSRTVDIARSDQRNEERLARDSRMEDSPRRVARSQSVDTARTDRYVKERLTRSSRMEDSQQRMASGRTVDTARTDRRMEERLSRVSRREDSQLRMARSRSLDTARTDHWMDERLTRDSHMEDSQRRMARSRSVDTTRTERTMEKRLTRDSRMEDSQRRMASGRTVDTARTDRRMEERLSRVSRREDSQLRMARSRSLDTARTDRHKEERLTPDSRMEESQRRIVRRRSVEGTHREGRTGDSVLKYQGIENQDHRRVDLRSVDSRSPETLFTTRTKGRIVRNLERRADSRRTVERRTTALQQTDRRLVLKERNAQISSRRTEDRNSAQRRQLESVRTGQDNDRRPSQLSSDRRIVTDDQQFDEDRRVSVRRSLSMTREQDLRAHRHLIRGPQKLDQERHQLLRKRYSERRLSEESRGQSRESLQIFNRHIATRSMEDSRFAQASERWEERLSERREHFGVLGEDRALIAARNLNRNQRSERALSQAYRVVTDIQSPKERTDVTRRESLTGRTGRPALTTPRQSHLRSDVHRTRTYRSETKDHRMSNRNALKVPERRSRELRGTHREVPAQNRRDMRSNNGEREIIPQDALRLENKRPSEERSRMIGRRVHYSEEVNSDKTEEGVRLERLATPYIIHNKEADINNNEFTADLQRVASYELWTTIRLGKQVYKALADFVSMDIPQNRLTAKVQEYSNTFTTEDNSTPSQLMSGLLAGAVLLLTARQAPVK